MLWKVLSTRSLFISLSLRNVWSSVVIHQLSPFVAMVVSCLYMVCTVTSHREAGPFDRVSSGPLNSFWFHSIFVQLSLQWDELIYSVCEVVFCMLPVNSSWTKCSTSVIVKLKPEAKWLFESGCSCIASSWLVLARTVLSKLAMRRYFYSNCISQLVNQKYILSLSAMLTYSWVWFIFPDLIM